MSCCLPCGHIFHSCASPPSLHQLISGKRQRRRKILFDPWRHLKCRVGNSPKHERCEQPALRGRRKERTFLPAAQRRHPCCRDLTPFSHTHLIPGIPSTDARRYRDAAAVTARRHCATRKQKLCIISPPSNFLSEECLFLQKMYFLPLEGFDNGYL